MHTFTAFKPFAAVGVLLRAICGAAGNSMAAVGFVARGIVRSAADVYSSAGVGLGAHVRRENFDGVVNAGNGEERFVRVTLSKRIRHGR